MNGMTDILSNKNCDGLSTEEIKFPDESKESRKECIVVKPDTTILNSLSLSALREMANSENTEFFTNKNFETSRKNTDRSEYKQEHFESETNSDEENTYTTISNENVGENEEANKSKIELSNPESETITNEENTDLTNSNENTGVNEVTSKTDDNGNIYCVDGKLQPNTAYELNGNHYATDEKGRIISCEATPVRTPENTRDIEAQRQAGGEYRKPNDQGAHIVGRDMNGDSGIGNLVAMDSKINQSDYKRMENDLKTALDEGKKVTTKTDISYSGNSERPDKITVTVTEDVKDIVYKFDNNLDGSLVDEIPENGKEIVQDVMNEKSGEISSIKEEYDENNNLIDTTVYITYKDDNGTNYRTSVVIENNLGGNNYE